MIISIVEYAVRQGKEPRNARRKAANGEFKTAHKKGKCWLIDDQEPWPEDRRVKTGEYGNWRNNIGKKLTAEFIVEKWQKENPGKRKSDCAKETGLSRPTINKWWVDG